MQNRVWVVTQYSTSRYSPEGMAFCILAIETDVIAWFKSHFPGEYLRFETKEISPSPSSHTIQHWIYLKGEIYFIVMDYVVEGDSGRES